jgi:hypothetical protein
MSAVAEVSLTQGKVARVDRANLPRLAGYTWHAHQPNPGLWYARTTTSRTSPGGRQWIYMHALLGGGRVDHRDGDGLNNTQDNLRPADRPQNGANRGPQSNNSSGFKGVYFCADRQRWAADITAYGQRHRLGRFSAPEEAAEAYDAAAMKYFGEFALTNAALWLLSRTRT